MKINSVLIVGSVLFQCSVGLAGKFEHPKVTSETPNKVNQNSFDLKKITPEFLYSYIDFNFDSTVGLNFNRFKGSSNLYSVGADHINILGDMLAGLYVLKVDTIVNSQMLIESASIIPSHQTIHNATLYGHVRKPISTNFSLDVAGGYGQNQIHSLTALFINTPSQNFASSNYYNENWLAGLNALYNKQWGNMNVRAYAGVLYSQLNTGNYLVNLQANNTPQTVAPLTTKTTYVIEGTELGYKLNSVITPFVNGALVQVADYTNSRVTISQPINGSLPQFIMNKNGFRVGGGFNFYHKQFTLRLEEKYYTAGSLFTSFQTLAALEYRFS